MKQVSEVLVMDSQSIPVFIDRAGKVPPQPIAGTFPSSDPGKLTAILAGIGLEVRRVTNPPGAVLARATGLALTIVRAMAPPAGAKNEVLHFRIPDLNVAFSSAVAAGASVALAPQPTPGGVRAVVVDPDHRRFLLTAASSVADAAEPSAGTTSEDERTKLLAETAPSRRILTSAVLLTHLATIVLVVATSFAVVRQYGGHVSDDLGELGAFGAALLFAISKGICLLDRGRLAGRLPLIAGLAIDAAAFVVFFMGVDERRVEAHMVGIGFVVSLALFSFYWSDAAESLRLSITRPLFLGAMFGWIVNAGLNVLLLLLVTRASAEGSRTPVLALAFVMALVQLITLVSWFSGLVGMTLGLLDPMKRPKPSGVGVPG
jgi:predicted enzyme related to lactoylglutathione lyase